MANKQGHGCASPKTAHGRVTHLTGDEPSFVFKPFVLWREDCRHIEYHVLKECNQLLRKAVVGFMKQLSLVQGHYADTFLLSLVCRVVISKGIYHLTLLAQELEENLVALPFLLLRGKVNYAQLFTYDLQFHSPQ